MRIVLPGALPDPPEARELLPHLEKAAPNLMAWLQGSRATCIVADPAQTYCTAWEFWQLRQHGFTPRPEQKVSSGLGPLLGQSVQTATDDPVWLVELSHISPSRDGAVLIPARELAISPEESDTLLQSAAELFDESGFSLLPCSTSHWQVKLTNDFRPHCPSPELVAITTVNDWWRQDEDGRNWRRLANEIQMLWFDHPVNQKRFEQGLMPINNVWLFGGASPSQLETAEEDSTSRVVIDRRLLEPMLAKDWGRWLQAAGELDSELFSTLAKESEVNMIGHDRIVSYITENRFWKRLRPSHKESWKQWWLTQN